MAVDPRCEQIRPKIICPKGCADIGGIIKSILSVVYVRMANPIAQTCPIKINIERNPKMPTSQSTPSISTGLLFQKTAIAVLIIIITTKK